jgi:hypothetical protein
MSTVSPVRNGYTTPNCRSQWRDGFVTYLAMATD